MPSVSSKGTVTEIRLTLLPKSHSPLCPTLKGTKKAKKHEILISKTLEIRQWRIASLERWQTNKVSLAIGPASCFQWVPTLGTKRRISGSVGGQQGSKSSQDKDPVILICKAEAEQRYGYQCGKGSWGNWEIRIYLYTLLMLCMTPPLWQKVKKN